MDLSHQDRIDVLTRLDAATTELVIAAGILHGQGYRLDARELDRAAAHVGNVQRRLAVSELKARRPL